MLGLASQSQNKLEYVQLMCEHRLKGQVLEQITAFRRGLNEVIEEESLAIFDEGELEVGFLPFLIDPWS